MASYPQEDRSLEEMELFDKENSCLSLSLQQRIKRQCSCLQGP